MNKYIVQSISFAFTPTTYSEQWGWSFCAITDQAGAQFNDAWTITKASAPCVEARWDDYIKGTCSPETSFILQLDRSALLLHSHQKDRSSLIFKLLQSWKYYLIFFNGHRNQEYLWWYFLKKLCSKALLHRSWSVIVHKLQPLSVSCVQYRTTNV